MGKKQHQKDKLYLTANEWSTYYGGKKSDNQKSDFKKLPFYCCCLSLQPFETPLATAEGLVFELLHIVPYIKKYGRNPATGKPMKAEDLIKLTYHKNSDGKYHCPVTFKIFNENTRIVAVRTTGNVYSHEAIERLNLRTHSMRDLLTDEHFSRSDLITLQDPDHPEKWDVSSFYHVKNKSDSEDGGDRPTTSTLRQMNPETKATLEALQNDELYQAVKEKKEAVTVKDKVPKKKAHFSTGQVSVGLTSTVMLPKTTNEAATVDRATQIYQMVNKKGYVRLHTSAGDVNLELHCDLVPKTCHNFILLSKEGFYDQTVFHRSIRNFMIQGGDPTGTGKGGQSAWKKPFMDEFKPNLTHTGRGIVSMANSGPNTNKSQFFITYRSCRHLDGKHTVFGRVVGGLDVLTEMERIPTDSNDGPTETIVISKVTVFVDPYEEAEAKIVEDHKAAQECCSVTVQDKVQYKDIKSTSSTVGKYISSKSGSMKRTKQDSTKESTMINKKLKLARP